MERGILLCRHGLHNGSSCSMPEGLKIAVSNYCWSEITDYYAKNIRKTNPGLELSFTKVKDSHDIDSKILKEALECTEIGILKPELVALFPDALPSTLKWVQSIWAGLEPLNNLDAGSKEKLKGCTFTRPYGIMGPAIAEHIIGLVIAIERKFQTLHNAQKKHMWSWISHEDQRIME